MIKEFFAASGVFISKSFKRVHVDMILLVEPMAEAGSHVVGATGDATVAIAHRFIGSIIGFTWYGGGGARLFLRL